MSAPVPPWRMPPAILCPHCEQLARYRFASGDTVETESGAVYFAPGRTDLACETHRDDVLVELGARHAFISIEPLRTTWGQWVRRALRRHWRRTTIGALTGAPDPPGEGP